MARIYRKIVCFKSKPLAVVVRSSSSERPLCFCIKQKKKENKKENRREKKKKRPFEQVSYIYVR